MPWKLWLICRSAVEILLGDTPESEDIGVSHDFVVGDVVVGRQGRAPLDEFVKLRVKRTGRKQWIRIRRPLYPTTIAPSPKVTSPSESRRFLRKVEIGRHGSGDEFQLARIPNSDDSRIQPLFEESFDVSPAYSSPITRYVFIGKFLIEYAHKTEKHRRRQARRHQAALSLASREKSADPSSSSSSAPSSSSFPSSSVSTAPLLSSSSSSMVSSVVECTTSDLSGKSPLTEFLLSPLLFVMLEYLPVSVPLLTVQSTIFRGKSCYTMYTEPYFHRANDCLEYLRRLDILHKYLDFRRHDKYWALRTYKQHERALVALRTAAGLYGRRRRRRRDGDERESDDEDGDEEDEDEESSEASTESEYDPHHRGPIDLSSQQPTPTRAADSADEKDSSSTMTGTIGSAGSSDGTSPLSTTKVAVISEYGRSKTAQTGAMSKVAGISSSAGSSSPLMKKPKHQLSLGGSKDESSSSRSTSISISGVSDPDFGRSGLHSSAMSSSSVGPISESEVMAPSSSYLGSHLGLKDGSFARNRAKKRVSTIALPEIDETDDLEAGAIPEGVVVTEDQEIDFTGIHPGGRFSKSEALSLGPSPLMSAEEDDIAEDLVLAPSMSPADTPRRMAAITKSKATGTIGSSMKRDGFRQRSDGSSSAASATMDGSDLVVLNPSYEVIGGKHRIQRSDTETSYHGAENSEDSTTLLGLSLGDFAVAESAASVTASAAGVAGAGVSSSIASASASSLSAVAETDSEKRRLPTLEDRGSNGRQGPPPAMKVPSVSVTAEDIGTEAATTASEESVQLPPALREKTQAELEEASRLNIARMAMNHGLPALPELPAWLNDIFSTASRRKEVFFAAHLYLIDMRHVKSERILDPSENLDKMAHDSRAKAARLYLTKSDAHFIEGEGVDAEDDEEEEMHHYDHRSSGSRSPGVVATHSSSASQRRGFFVETRKRGRYCFTGNMIVKTATDGSTSSSGSSGDLSSAAGKVAMSEGRGSRGTAGTEDVSDDSSVDESGLSQDKHFEHAAHSDDQRRMYLVCIKNSSKMSELLRVNKSERGSQWFHIRFRRKSHCVMGSRMTREVLGIDWSHMTLTIGGNYGSEKNRHYLTLTADDKRVLNGFLPLLRINAVVCGSSSAIVRAIGSHG